jgi:hypothetical protein
MPHWKRALALVLVTAGILLVGESTPAFTISTTSGGQTTSSDAIHCC